MALIRCKECGKDISDQAPTCPGCGAPKHVAHGLPEAWTSHEQKAEAPPAQPTAKPNAQTSTPPPAPKRSSGCAVVVIGGFGLLVFATIVGRCSSPTTPTESVGNQPSAVPPSNRGKKPPSNLIKQLEDETLSDQNRLGVAQALIRNYPGTIEAQKASEFLPKLQQERASPESGGKWRYNSYEDTMSSKSVLDASITSVNSFEFDFPYQGTQTATLTLRKHPRWGNDVIFSIEKGQILCSTYECPVRVRFDDSPPQTFSGNEPSDNSSEYVFIPGYPNFSKKLQKAKRVRIEVNVFQQGTLVADFNVEGFNPEKL